MSEGEQLSSPSDMATMQPTLRQTAGCESFEQRLEGSSDLPELTRITAAAIALFVSRLVLTGVAVEKLILRKRS
jgi:hypothetical protein